MVCSVVQSMQVGPPPANGFGVDWRGAAYVQDKKSPVVAPLRAELGPAHDSSGGWMVKGPGGNIKMTQPTAFTTSMLAWGVLSFPTGYGSSKQQALTQIQVRSACVSCVSSLCTCAKYCPSAGCGPGCLVVGQACCGSPPCLMLKPHICKLSDWFNDFDNIQAQKQS